MSNANFNEQPNALYKGLEFLLNIINVILIANHRIVLISPVIQAHGIYFEREKFKNKLTNDSLERTSLWLTNSLKKKLTDNNVQLQDLLDNKEFVFLYIYSSAVITLISNDLILKKIIDFYFILL